MPGDLKVESGHLDAPLADPCPFPIIAQRSDLIVGGDEELPRFFLTPQSTGLDGQLGAVQAELADFRMKIGLGLEGDDPGAQRDVVLRTLAPVRPDIEDQAVGLDETSEEISVAVVLNASPQSEDDFSQGAKNAKSGGEGSNALSKKNLIHGGKVPPVTNR